LAKTDLDLAVILIYSAMALIEKPEENPIAKKTDNNPGFETSIALLAS